MSTTGQLDTRLAQFAKAFWIGTEMIVLARNFNFDSIIAARYNPATDAWAPINTTLGPTDFDTVVWTGTEILAWTDIQSNTDGRLTGGGRYNPTTDTWTPISIIGAPAKTRVLNDFNRQVGVWTGKEMLILNIKTDVFDPWYESTGAYDPATDTWRSIRVSGAPRPCAQAVWDGKEMLLLGACSAAGRYDPVSDTWRSLNTSGMPSLDGGRSGGPEVLLWTGAELIAWGKRTNFPSNDNAGAKYDPVADTWTPMSNVGAPHTGEYVGVWTGQQLIVVGAEVPRFDTRIPAAGIYCDLVGFVPPCSVSLSPANTSFNSLGGSGTLTLTAESQCKWTASTNASWITITSATSGTGSAVITYSVSPYTQLSPFVRQATIEIGDASLSISQTAPPSIFTISVRGKDLFVTGVNFGVGARILVDGLPQKTQRDASGALVGKKSAKKLRPGATVSVQVQNGDGSLSEPVSFTR